MATDKNLGDSFLHKNSSERKELHDSLHRLHPDRISVVVVAGDNTENKGAIIKKCLLGKHVTIQKLTEIVRKCVQLDAHKSIYLTVNNAKSFLANQTKVGDLYQTCKSEDGFMYITYHIENAFG